MKEYTVDEIEKIALDFKKMMQKLHHFFIQHILNYISCTFL